jgi:predicted membrane metal-binding protein
MNRGTTSGGDPCPRHDATSDTGRFAVARRFPLVVVLAALASGIVVGCYVSIGPVIWWSVALVSLVLWRPLRARPLSVWLVLLAVMATGAAWHQLRWNFFPADELGRFARRQTSPVYIEAIALQRPVLVPARPADPLCTLPQGDQSRLEVSLLRLRNRTVWQPVSGRVLLAVEGHLLGVAPGDLLRVAAQLSRPWPAQNPGQFAFSDHERSQRRLCRLKAAYPDCVVVRSKASRWSLRWLVQRLRNGSNDMLWHHLGHPRSDLAAAVLLGAREQLDRDRVEAFFHRGAASS